MKCVMVSDIAAAFDIAWKGIAHAGLPAGRVLLPGFAAAALFAGICFRILPPPGRASSLGPGRAGQALPGPGFAASATGPGFAGFQGFRRLDCRHCRDCRRDFAPVRDHRREFDDIPVLL